MVGIDFIVLVGLGLGHIVVDNDIDLFNINTSGKEISRDKNSAATLLELSVSFNSNFHFIG